jgi:aryl-alcohol dehydrogenase-like predicted oxidoreductase
LLGALAGGLLSGKFTCHDQKPGNSRRSVHDFPIVNKERAWNIVDVIGPIAKARECSPAQVALAWILSKPFVTTVLMGAKRMDQLKNNLAAIHLKLTQVELKTLDEVSQLSSEYPEWMLAIQGADRLGPIDHRSNSVNQK